MIHHNKYKSLFWDDATSKWQHLHKQWPKDKSICLVLRCTKHRRSEWVNGFGLKYWPYCPKCSKRQTRANNPIRELYVGLKHSATRRKINFDLSFSDFISFCVETNYTDRNYKTKTELTCVDRIDPSKGYTYDNIQLITNGQNVAKGNRERQTKPTVDPDNCPF